MAHPADLPWQGQSTHPADMFQKAPPAPLDTFEQALADAENSVKAGFDKQASLWKPHSSLEGGSDTLAYGHKLTPEEVKSGTVAIGGQPVDYTAGLTEEQAVELLRQDVDTHKELVKKNISDFDQLDERYKNVLVNISFNAGPPTEGGWPKLLAAMRAGDDAEVRKQMVTVFTDPQGKVTRLENRASDIADALKLGR